MFHSRPPLHDESPVWLLIGCTAVGKTDVAVELAQRTDAEIVSVDSRLVYRRMDIGTAKPGPDVLACAPHHLVDRVEPWETFSVAGFVELADAAIADVRARGRMPLLVAGTPFYLVGTLFGLFEGPSADPAFRRALRQRAAAEGTAALHAELAALDPAAAARIHRNDLARIERALEVHRLTGRPISELQREWSGPSRYAYRCVGLRRTAADLSRRINARVRAMAEAGLVDEVRALWSDLRGLSDQARQALGYAEIIEHLEGRATLDGALEQIKIDTRRFAKSQRTWFRRIRDANWLDLGESESPEQIARRAIEAFSSTR
ncbi:MAG: tRNA (adenosine(37)-N6)-dimethylallyltransferase MiaA [Phycisphaerae bacterium]|nr:tRNA (adenosine(37)-N6)-dimethylallyltransferase MiaA [Phycisphaerae bacterium]